MNELTINEKEIGLWRLKTELAELMAFRQDEELEPEARDAIDAQIKAYVKASLRKIDNVSGFIRYRRSGAAEARTEAKRLSALADSWERDEEYLLGLVKDLMIEFKETKLEGRYGYLKLQANGGSQTLEIYNAELVPEELCEYHCVIPSERWNRIVAIFGGLWKEMLIGMNIQRVPKPAAVREVLKDVCPLCEGAGMVSDNRSERVHCPACEGTGKARSVPGARLEPRGQHVRLK